MSNDVYELRLNQAASWNGQQVSVGQIESISIPHDWIEGTSEDNVRGDSFYREFSDVISGARISFYYRGRPLSDGTDTAFKSILGRDLGELSRIEFASIAPELIGVLAYSSNFEIKVIRVSTLNGKRILEINGRYLDETGPLMTTSKQIFIDVLGDGRIVQQIEIQSPEDKSKVLESTLDMILDSIKWKWN